MAPLTCCAAASERWPCCARTKPRSPRTTVERIRVHHLVRPPQEACRVADPSQAKQKPRFTCAHDNGTIPAD
jgi:hypothetical protein